MDIAAIAGIYAAMQTSAPDPRVGLTNLLISGESIRNALASAAESGPYPSLLPMIATLDSIETDLFRLGDKWLTPDVISQVRLITTRKDAKDSTPLAALLVVNEMLLTKFKMPKSIQIDSSFVQFDDNGVLERGLGKFTPCDSPHKKVGLCLHSCLWRWSFVCGARWLRRSTTLHFRKSKRNSRICLYR